MTSDQDSNEMGDRLGTPGTSAMGSDFSPEWRNTDSDVSHRFSTLVVVHHPGSISRRSSPRITNVA